MVVINVIECGFVIRKGRGGSDCHRELIDCLKVNKGWARMD